MESDNIYTYLYIKDSGGWLERVERLEETWTGLPYMVCHVYLQLLKLAQELANLKSDGAVIMPQCVLVNLVFQSCFHCLLFGTLCRPFYVAIFQNAQKWPGNPELE